MSIEERPQLPPDERIVYGAVCSWWGGIGEVAVTASGLPCCPHCGGVLLEVENEAEWWAGARRHEAGGNPGYVEFLEWLREHHYPSLEAARAAYAAETDRGF